MSFLRTLLLVALAAGLGAWLYFVEEPKAERAARADFLIDVEPSSVARVRLAYGDAPAIELERDGEGWKLAAPIAYPADASVVENFLTTVKDTKIERRLAAGETGPLANYGLDGDTGTQGRLELRTTDGRDLPATVLGIATPVGYQAFARREGSDEVLVIPLLLQSTVRKTPFDLRSKKMFTEDGSSARRVVLEKAGVRIEVEKAGEGSWTMKSPVVDRADHENVRSMLDSIATIDAIAFFDGAEADRKAFGLDDAATRFTMEREDGSRLEFAVGKEATDAPAGSYFERASDRQVIKVPDWVATKFAADANALRDRRFLNCRLDDIVSLAWQAGDSSFSLSREAAGKPWTMEPAPPAGQQVNQAIVDNAVNALALARADAVVGDAATEAELAASGLAAPTARLDVKTATGSCGSLQAAPAPPSPADAAAAPPGRPAPPKYRVRVAERTAVLEASAHEYSRLAMKASDFLQAGEAAIP